MTSQPPELRVLQVKIDADAQAAERRKQAKRRRADEARRAAWETTGWGAVGVVECSANPYSGVWHGDIFDGPAYVYDTIDGRVYWCSKCQRLERQRLARWLAKGTHLEWTRNRVGLLATALPEPCIVCGRPFAWVEGHALAPAGLLRPRPRPRLHICSEFCRRERRNRARRASPDERPCAVCPKRFRPKRADAIYCSRACQQAAYRARSK